MKKNNKYYKVAYLGIPGSFSHTAAKKFFNKKTYMISNKSITEIFKKVADDSRSFGVVPLENSTTGSITETFDLLLDNKLSIVGEAILKVHHQLCGKSLIKPQQIKFCYSHPQAISQCASFLAKYPWIKPAFTSDTASAAKLVAKKKETWHVAITSLEAVKIYRLLILSQNIEENPNNFTRFVIVAKKQRETGNKISLAFSLPHTPGSLFKALRPYAEAGLNLTKIESRPVFGRPWEYIFFLDFEIEQAQKTKQVITAMKKEVTFLTILGRYKKGETYET